ncbi:MAG: hypothetical protein IT223_08715 [Crocinitomicaceae bacterium]|nr:hypothetical protein [Crocinitomicaceae bacterium]
MRPITICFSILSLLFTGLGHHSAYAQGVAINGTGSLPNPSAMLDISGTSTGVLINRMTETQRDGIPNPAYGLMIINTDTDCLNMWDGTSWKQLCWDCSFVPAPTNNGPVCEGDNLNLYTPSIEGATYEWSGPGGFVSTEQNPQIPNATISQSGIYSVRITKDGCTSQPKSTSATIHPIPSGTASSNSPLCVGESLVLSTEDLTGAVFNWSGPNGYISQNQNPEIGNVQVGQAGAYHLVISKDGCSSPVFATAVEVSNIPSYPGSITGNNSICPNAADIVYSVEAVEGALGYTWNIPPGASITLDSGTSITVTFGNTPAGNLTVTADNTCGSSSVSSLSIITNSVCPPLTFDYTGTMQTFVVPDGVTQVTLDVYGAQGFDSTYGGKGGQAKGTISVTPGQTLNIYVGQMGTGTGGWWNGGESTTNGSGCLGTVGGTGYGGGASDIRIGGTALANRVIVAGGGGGRGLSAGVTLTYGGHGGGNIGGSGSTNYTAVGGGGGTQSAGGAGGSGGFGSANSGGLGTGGDRCPGDWGGGDGGGGYYGGGGGSGSSGSHRAGGGGGSNYLGGVTPLLNNQGIKTGNGMVIISW